MSSKKAPETRTIRLETLSRQAFSPFGDTLSPDGLDPLPITLYGDRIDAWCPALLESDQPMEYLITRSKIREFRVVYVERHLQLTQTFIPLGGCAFISVVARPDAREEGGIPALDELHAFLIPGNAAVNIHRGTWHEVPFPLQDDALMLVTSHRSLTRGLESKPTQGQEIHKLDVEKRNVTERTGLILRVELL